MVNHSTQSSSDDDTDSTNHTAVDNYVDTTQQEEEGEPKRLSVSSSRQSRGNQSFLHNASQYVPPLEASDFPLTVEDTNAGVDAAEFIAEREKGYIEEPDGTKLVTFNPNDPENPRNWSKNYKWLVTCIIALVCFGVAFASAAVTGDLDGVCATFHVSMEVAILTVTVFVIGFGIGPLVFAPLSEIVGRRPVYAVTLLVALVFIIPCALAKNIGTLIVCRLIDGIAFSAPMCLVGGTLADIWDNDERGPAMAFFSAAPFIGPGVGPIVGGFIGETVGWRWIYWVLLMFMGLIYVLCLLVPETFAPTILTKRAKRLRKETGDDSYKTETERNPRPLKELAKISLIRPMELLVRELIVLLISVYMSIIYGLLYMFFFAYPVIYAEGKGYSAGIVGLMFIPLILGVMASAMIAPFINTHYLKLAKKHNGNPPAEVRLIPMMASCCLPPIGLFIFAWTSYPHVHWIGPAIAGFPCGLGFCVLYNAANNYLVDTYQHYAASALAAKTFLRSMWGACVPLFTIQMYHRLGYEWAGSLLAFISLACCVIPFLFYIYGARIRSYSKFAYSPEDESEEVIHKIKTSHSVAPSAAEV